MDRYYKIIAQFLIEGSPASLMFVQEIYDDGTVGDALIVEDDGEWLG